MVLRGRRRDQIDGAVVDKQRRLSPYRTLVIVMRVVQMVMVLVLLMQTGDAVNRRSDQSSGGIIGACGRCKNRRRGFESSDRA